MRIFLTALTRCWILLQTQNLKESTDVDSEEGPVRKYRRLTLDHGTAASCTMDLLKKEQSIRDIFTGGLRTRDIGVLCTERVPVNDKCIMVGTTGIAALKAEYGDDFTKIEIIQDVGYSSESSTHLSGDDTGTDHPFSIQIFKYSKENQPLSLKQELEAVTGCKSFQHLGSSLESSSSAAASLDDSGLGVGDGLAIFDPEDVISQSRVPDELCQEELDFLETVLDEYVDFGVNTVSEPEELHFNISGIESDDQLDDFHKRSSFTTSAQVFYKMISVDSDNGEGDSTVNENNTSNRTLTETADNDDIKTVECNNNTTNFAQSDLENFKHIQDFNPENEYSKNSQNITHKLCSTPIKNSNCKYSGGHQQGLKRKRDYDTMESTRMSNHVRSWLTGCSSITSPIRPRKPSNLVASSSHRRQFSTQYISSCDASCECTSSSADEDNINSSASSFFEEDPIAPDKEVSSCSIEGSGSVETIVHALLDSEFALLPPPPSSSASCGSDSKNYSNIKVRYPPGHNRLTKAASTEDIGRRRSTRNATDSSSHHVIQRDNHTTNINHRVYSSLPNVYRHSSDSSTDDNCVPSAPLSNSDTPKSTRCANRSSSSEAGRRRRRTRKKSSSSIRSSTSVLINCGNRARHISRNTCSRQDNRTGHRSQHSDFYCVENVFSDEENCGLEVEIPFEENTDYNEHSAVLLSPAESDIVLTHLEEQSTVSDQVWDGYQEMPYLSEGYSEATVDEDAVRKLTEFGDDYTSAIGQPLRLLVKVDSKNSCKNENSKSPKKSVKSISSSQRLSTGSQDSDSDSEGLHYVIEESEKALNFARNTLKKGKSADCWTSADQAELLATCGTHLNCLQSIGELIVDGKENIFSVSDVTKLQNLIEEWQELKQTTEMYGQTEEVAEKKYQNAQQNIDDLYHRMSEIASSAHLDVNSLKNWEDIEKNLKRLQMVLESLQETKEQLLIVNLQVHRFTTEYGSEDQFKDSNLKSDITELYRKWDDIYEQNGAHLTELQCLRTDWQLYETKLESLRVRVQEYQQHSGAICDNSCSAPAAGLSIRRLREDVDDLEDKAACLRTRLKGGYAWNIIEQDLQNLKREIDVYDLLTNTFPRTNHRRSSSINFEDEKQQLFGDKTDSCSSVNLSKKTSKTPKESPPKPKSRSKLWRIVRMAIPVQLALVLLYCFACYMEPSCCNMLNNFGFSFTPQLRYLGGGPPI